MNIDKELKNAYSAAYSARSAAYSAAGLSAQSAAWSAIEVAYSEERKKQLEIIKEMI